MWIGHPTLRAKLIGTCVSVLLAACSTQQVDVSWEYDPHLSLAGLQTYAWEPDLQPGSSDPRLDDVVDRRIRTAVERALDERGYVKVEAERANFWVAYYARMADKIDTSTMQSYSGYEARLTGVGRARGWNVGGPPITYSRVSEEGFLNLFIVDPRTKEAVWHALGQAETSPKDSREKREQRLLEAARLMLSKFPPPQSNGSADKP